MNAREQTDEDVELGEEVNVKRRSKSALVAVRLPSELLERVQAYAVERGLTVSDVMRMGAERVASEGLTTATAYTVRTVQGYRWVTAAEFTLEPLTAGSVAFAR